MIESIFVSKTKEHPYINNFYYYQLLAVISFTLTFFNYRIKKHNFEKIPSEPCLFVINHTSGFDPLIVLQALKSKRTVFVSKEEVFKTPFVGNFMRGSGTISLDRDDLRDAVKVLHQCKDYLTRQKVNIVIAPEGTRSKDNQIHEFHPGSFKAAKESNCPIVLLNIASSTQFNGHLIFKKKMVDISVIEILNNDDYKNMNTSEISTLAHTIYLQNKR